MKAMSYTSSSSTRRSFAGRSSSVSRVGSGVGSSFGGSSFGGSTYGGFFSQISNRQGNVGFGAGGNTYSAPMITDIQFNSSLLVPQKYVFDQNIPVIRNQEKEQIKALNNRFATFIDKVRFLEQQNKMLETKWSFLQQQTTNRTNLDGMFEAYVANLRRQLDGCGSEKMKLDSELKNMQHLVEDFKTKYEEEIHKRTAMEGDFVILKKDVDAAYMVKVELEAKVNSIEEEIAFLRELYQAEINELQVQIKDTSVIVEMDNSRDLDMDAIVAEVRAQYEDIAKRSKAEAESWYKQKIDDVTDKAGQYETNLRTTKAEISELTRAISRLQNEIESVKTQKGNIEVSIQALEQEHEVKIKMATESIEKLKQSLQESKSIMTKKIREYQDLMNIKLALDIEIATYRKLLEGEESRLSSGGSNAIIHVQSSSATMHSTNETDYGRSYKFNGNF